MKVDMDDSRQLIFEVGVEIFKVIKGSQPFEAAGRKLLSADQAGSAGDGEFRKFGNIVPAVEQKITVSALRGDFHAAAADIIRRILGGDTAALHGLHNGGII